MSQCCISEQKIPKVATVLCVVSSSIKFCSKEMFFENFSPLERLRQEGLWGPYSCQEMKQKLFHNQPHSMCSSCMYASIFRFIHGKKVQGHQLKLPYWQRGLLKFSSCKLCYFHLLHRKILKLSAKNSKIIIWKYHIQANIDTIWLKTKVKFGIINERIAEIEIPKI